MQTKIHYEENLFYLNAKMKIMVQAFDLKIDPGFFSEKVAEDLFFIDACLDKLYNTLKENPHLLHKNDYLILLAKTKSNFAGLIDGLLAKKYPFSSSLSQHIVRLQSCLRNHRADVNEIRGTGQWKEDKNEDLISGEELGFLLKQDEE